MREKKKKRGAVMYVSVTASFQSGGDRSFFATVMGMHRRGTRHVEVTLPCRNDMAILFEDAGIRVNYIPMMQAFRAPGFVYRARFMLKLAADVPRLIHIFMTRRSRIIHVNQTRELQPLLAAWLTPGVKLVTHHRGTILYPKLFGRLINVVGFMLADHIVIVSNALAKVCFTPRERKSPRLSIIHGGQGLDLSVFDPEKYPPDVREKRRMEITGRAGGFVVGFVSKFVDNRGHDLFVLAAEKARALDPGLDIRYVIVGGALETNDAFHRKVLNMIDDKGLKDVFFLTGAQKYVADFNCIFDVLVHLPIEWDSFPTVILEAMAMGKAVIGHRLGGIPEQVVEDVTGWMVDTGDIDALAEKIVFLARNPEVAREAGAAGRQALLKNFSLESYFNKIEALYDRLEGLKL